MNSETGTNTGAFSNDNVRQILTSLTSAISTLSSNNFVHTENQNMININFSTGSNNDYNSISEPFLQSIIANTNNFFGLLDTTNNINDNTEENIIEIEINNDNIDNLLDIDEFDRLGHRLNNRISRISSIVDNLLVNDRNPILSHFFQSNEFFSESIIRGESSFFNRTNIRSNIRYSKREYEYATLFFENYLRVENSTNNDSANIDSIDFKILNVLLEYFFDQVISYGEKIEGSQTEHNSDPTTPSSESNLETESNLDFELSDQEDNEISMTSRSRLERLGEEINMNDEDRDEDELDLESIKDIMISSLIDENCRCSNMIEHQQIVDMWRYYIFVRSEIPRCIDTPHIIEYYLIQKQYPTEEELRDYRINQLQFIHSPEDYYQKDRMHVPVTHVDKLPIKQYQELTNESRHGCDSCALCQSDFESDTNVIQLIPCGHIFHQQSKDCLETSSIYDWMKEHNHCPLCKTKINPLHSESAI